jgi:hypothetical protein
VFMGRAGEVRRPWGSVTRAGAARQRVHSRGV